MDYLAPIILQNSTLSKEITNKIETTVQIINQNNAFCLIGFPSTYTYLPFQNKVGLLINGYVDNGVIVRNASNGSIKTSVYIVNDNGGLEIYIHNSTNTGELLADGWAYKTSFTDYELVTKIYSDSLITNLLNSVNNWTKDNQFSRLLCNDLLFSSLWGGLVRNDSGNLVVSENDQSAFKCIYNAGGSALNAPPALYFSISDRANANENATNYENFLIFYNEKRQEANYFWKGQNLYKTLQINTGLNENYVNYMNNESTNKEVAVHGIFAANHGNDLYELNFNELYCGSGLKPFELITFADSHPIFPAHTFFGRNLQVYLSGYIRSLTNTCPVYGLFFTDDKKIKYLHYKNDSSDLDGMNSIDNWGAYTNQVEDSEILTKGYLDSQNYVQNNNAASCGIASSSIVTNGTRTGALATYGSTLNGSGVAIIGSTGCAIGSGQAYSSVIAANTCQLINSSYAMVSGLKVVNNEQYTWAWGYGSTAESLTANRKVEISSIGGTIKATGTITNGATFNDYAEYFENLDTTKEIPLGTIVSLSGRKVRVAKSGDSILGIVSGTSAVATGDSPFTWSQRYMTGEFGEILYNEVPDPAWSEKVPDPNYKEYLPYNEVEPKIIDPAYKTYIISSYNEETGELSEIPNPEPPTYIDNPYTFLVKNPNPQQMIDNPEPRQMVSVPMENPNFDISQINIPRSKRPKEWTCVGLLGQLYVRVDNSVSTGDYIKVGNNDGIGTKLEQTDLTGDIIKGIEQLRLKCMEISQPYSDDKGYAVAYCLLR